MQSLLRHLPRLYNYAIAREQHPEHFRRSQGDVQVKTTFTESCRDSNSFQPSRSSRFTGGMNCINQYLDKCTNFTVRAVIESEISGAKRLFQHLCGSTKFKENYLHHASCFRSTRQDWNDCIGRYRSIIQHEIKADEPRTPVTKYLHYCWWVLPKKFMNYDFGEQSHHQFSAPHPKQLNFKYFLQPIR